MKICNNKVIVFDLDETIGHFEQVSMFLNGIQNIVKPYISDKYIFKLLDIWPNIFRYKIFEIFKLIKKAKIKNNSIKVVIYTNNMGPRYWTLLLKKYIENKLKFKLFDSVITAYRPQEKTNFRTTHEKTHSDLVRSLKYKNCKFIFFDDVYHHYMKHKDIKYIKLHPYKFSISFTKMIDDYLKSKHNKLIYGDDIVPFKEIMLKFLNSDKEKYYIKNTSSKINIQEYKKSHHEVKKFLNITKKNRKHTRKN
tara:strand:+ start:1431 stop:2183 length:753 start_codon:yes stop_codon:yes gene_type:complete